MTDLLPFASVYHNTTQNVVTGVQTAISFNSEYSDENAWHDNASNNNRITVGATGYYQGMAYIQYSGAGGSGQYWDTLAFRINGTNFAEDRRWQNVDAYAKMFNTSSPIVAMSAGQYMDVTLEQNSGGTRAVVANVKFSVLKVG